MAFLFWQKLSFKKKKRADRQDPDARVCLHVYTNPPAGSAPGHGRGRHEHRAGPTCGPEPPVLTDPRSPETSCPGAPTKKPMWQRVLQSVGSFAPGLVRRPPGEDPAQGGPRNPAPASRPARAPAQRPRPLERLQAPPPS